MTLPNTDLFIINRNTTNYQVDYNNLKQYIPGMPKGARCLFYMDSAPYGWTLDTDSKFTEATVRVMSGGGGANSGTKDFSYVFKNWTTSVPTHNHGISGGTHKHGGSVSHGHTVRDPFHAHGGGGFGPKHQHPPTGPNGVAGSQYGGGRHVRLHKWSWRQDEQQGSGSSDGGGGGGTPVAGKTGTSVADSSPNITFANSTTSGLKTTDTTGNVGTSLDFTVKYHKSIVCQKDPY